MRERIAGNVKAEILTFDFRCRSDDITIKNDIASIWLASLTDENGAQFFNNIQDFTAAILKRAEKYNICLYCFDLGFHWSFIFYELIRLNFKYVRRVTKASENVFSAFGTSSATLVYSACIRGKKTGGTIYFKDLQNVYTGYKNLDEMAASFKSDRPFYPDDHAKEHPEGGRPSKKEMDNCASRSGFIFDVLKKQSGDPRFFQSFTLASYSMKTAIYEAFERLKRPGRPYAPFAVYRSSRMFPRTKDKKEIEALRASIFGGLTGPTIEAIDRGKLIEGKILAIDKTQAYPAEMAYSKLPRGIGEKFDGYKGIEHGKAHLFHLKINSFAGVKIHSIPYLMQKRKHFMMKGEEPIYLWVWEWEYYLMFACYVKLDCEILGGYSYAMGKSPFASYILKNQQKRNELEAAGDNVAAAHHKYLNVCLYGKLIQKDSTEIVEQTTDEDGIITTKIMKREEAKEAAYIYLPAGSAIPSLARCANIRKALEFGPHNVFYIETDALMIADNEETRAVLDKMDLSHDLGHYHLEACVRRAYFPMAKRYKYELESGEVVVKGAGITLDSLGKGKGFDDVKLEDVTIEMRQKKKAYGGTILIRVKKKLRRKREG